MFAVQITLVDIINPHIDSVKLSAMQFIVAGILSFVFMLFTEKVNFNDIYLALPAILYAAIFSGCIAYTFQIIGQKYTEPTIASMIMSLESVFALFGGVIILKEELTLRLIIGCILIFISVVCAQIDFKKLFKK
jgi:drug/metabolite transporter (DMT)-like permease